MLSPSPTALASINLAVNAIQGPLTLSTAIFCADACTNEACTPPNQAQPAPRLLSFPCFLACLGLGCLPAAMPNLLGLCQGQWHEIPELGPLVER